MDDEYVAKLMAKEAAESSKKYSLEGLGAYQSHKRDINAPRANTRFLRHLIKETDNHNTALKRKEEREARDRMRAHELGSKRLSPAPGIHEREPSSSKDSSRRHRDDHRYSRHSARRDDRRDDRHESRHDSHSRSHRKSHRRRSRSRSSERDRSRKRRRRDDDDRRSKDTLKGKEHRGRQREDDRDRSREDDRGREHRHSRRSTTHRRRPTYSESRSRSPRRDRSTERDRSRRHKSPSSRRSPHSQRTQERRSRRDDEKRSPKGSQTVEHHQQKNSSTQRRDNGDESDPLEDMFGPLPPPLDGDSAAPVRSRGRGAYKPSSSNIDSHFAPDYDPTADVQPDEDESFPSQPARRPVAGLMTQEDDWDMALEAVRDRARWKQQGEDRLRAAGINESIIERWKDNTTSNGSNSEKKPEDVRWSKKGEGREWDRGKVMDDHGHTDVHASW